MMKKSGQCRTTPDRTTATSIIQGIGPQKYERNFRSALVFFSAISFGPYWVSRFVRLGLAEAIRRRAQLLLDLATGSDFRSSGRLEASAIWVTAAEAGSAASP